MARLYREIVRELLRDAVAGGVPASGRFPSEQEIADRFACSRSVAREAIRALEERRVVAVRAGHGQRLLEADRWDVLDADVATALLVDHRDPDLLRQAVEVVRLVEAQAARLAATRARPGDRDLLAAAVERLRTASGGADGATPGGDPFAAAEAAFHRTVVLLSGNRFLAAALATLHPALATARRRRAADRDALSIRLHERIVAAFRDRDPSGAAE